MLNKLLKLIGFQLITVKELKTLETYRGYCKKHNIKPVKRTVITMRVA